MCKLRVSAFLCCLVIFTVFFINEYNETAGIKQHEKSKNNLGINKILKAHNAIYGIISSYICNVCLYLRVANLIGIYVQKKRIHATAWNKSPNESFSFPFFLHHTDFVFFLLYILHRGIVVWKKKMIWKQCVVKQHYEEQANVSRSNK